jgi:DNA-binding HxlR family transcriptional regulator
VAAVASISPLSDALDRVGDRWTLLTVAVLLDGPKRFKELEVELEGIAPNILSSRLKALAEHGLVVQQPYSERPPRFDYRLTDAGAELAGALRLLADWGARAGEAEPLRHGRCGTALRATWWCDTCAEPVADPDADEPLDFV